MKKKPTSRLKYLAGGVLLVGVVALIVTGTGARVVDATYDAFTPRLVFTRSVKNVDDVPKPPERTRHITPPPSVKAVYMSQCAVGTPSFRTSLVKLLDETELNAIVIDIRDYTGRVSFPTTHPLLTGMESDECGARDMKEFIDLLHGKGIYVIGRITVFQNPYYTKLHPEQAVQKKGGGVWKDHKGLAFVDVGATDYWETVVALAKESYEIGFDEINFDYIRYPSDGDMASAVYIKRDGKTKQEMLEDFFEYLHRELTPTGMIMSADLFGMVTTNYDDLNIGQVLERALPYFDYIAPMVYPSHYPKGFLGFEDVNKHPYEIVYHSMQNAVERTVATTTTIASKAYTRIGTTTPAQYAKPSYSAQKIRPWLQDFDYPVAYTPAMVNAQIEATYDAGLTSFYFWDPANQYSSLKEVVATST